MIIFILGEFSAAEFIKDVKKEPSMIGLKDNIRRLNQALRMKEQTIQSECMNDNRNTDYEMIYRLSNSFK